MKREKRITESSFIKDNWLFNASELNFDLPLLIAMMKQEFASKNDEPMAKILLNNYEKQIVLTMLNEDTEIDSFQDSESVIFQLIEGKLKFRAGKESIFLEKGQILVLCKKINYTFISCKETVLITIINSTFKLCEN